MHPKSIVGGRMSVGTVSRFDAHGSTFEVKKLGIETYCLRASAGPASTGAAIGRMRFGTLKEIRQDVGRVLETGALPPRERGSWA